MYFKTRIKKIDIYNYKIEIPEISQDKNVILLIGKNGTGKSQLLSFIGYLNDALYNAKNCSHTKDHPLYTHTHSPYFSNQQGKRIIWEIDNKKLHFRDCKDTRNAVYFKDFSEFKKRQINTIIWSSYKIPENELNLYMQNTTKNIKSDRSYIEPFSSNKILLKLIKLMHNWNSKVINGKDGINNFDINSKIMNKIKIEIYEHLKLYLSFDNTDNIQEFKFRNGKINGTNKALSFEEIKIMGNNPKHPIFTFSHLSSGEQEIIKMVLYFTYLLLSNKVDIFLIDEIEIMINSNIQSWLLKFLIKINSWFGNKVQIIITSHSCAIIESAFSDEKIFDDKDDAEFNVIKKVFEDNYKNTTFKDCINLINMNNFKNSSLKTFEPLEPIRSNYMELQKIGVGFKIVNQIIGIKHLIVFIEGEIHSWDYLIFTEINKKLKKYNGYTTDDYKITFHPCGPADNILNREKTIKNTMKQITGKDNLIFKTIMLKDGDCKNNTKYQNYPNLFLQKITIDFYVLSWKVISKILKLKADREKYLNKQFIKSWNKNKLINEKAYFNDWILKYASNNIDFTLKEFNKMPQNYKNENKSADWSKGVITKIFHNNIKDNDFKIDIINKFMLNDKKIITNEIETLIFKLE